MSVASDVRFSINDSLDAFAFVLLPSPPKKNTRAATIGRPKCTFGCLGGPRDAENKLGKTLSKSGLITVTENL